MLSNENFVSLKYALSDINNLVTQKVGLAFIDYACKLFKLTKNERDEIITKFDSTKPNTNGFDIDFVNKHLQILAEIKSTAPMNQGDRFGIGQINSILDDAIKLISGGKKAIDTSNVYKFIGILDVGEPTNIALEAVFKHRSLKVPHELRQKRNLVKERLILLDNPTSFKLLSKENIYVVKISI